MVRELLIGLYLLVFKIQFNIFKWFPLKNKVAFVVSFSQNSLFVYKEMQKRPSTMDTVFLCDSSSYEDMKHLENTATIIQFDSQSAFKSMKAIFHLATSKFIIIDNYFAFLSAIKFKKEVQCIQLWHAAGAIKTFGLKDKSITKRTNRANKRFQRVYHQFHKIIVGSDSMANIFMEAFNISGDNILKTGIPRTDLFFDEIQTITRTRLLTQYPFLYNKKVILYAPTFRDGKMEHFEVPLDFEDMYRNLRDQFVLLIKLHPAIQHKTNYKDQFSGFIYDFSDYRNVNDLLLVTDYLITDYSSIPFEFALLEKPMIFYPFDLNLYSKERGLWEQYEVMVPGPIVRDTKELVKTIKENQFDIDKIREFSNKWNKYSKGQSSKNLVDYICNNRY